MGPKNNFWFFYFLLTYSQFARKSLQTLLTVASIAHKWSAVVGIQRKHWVAGGGCLQCRTSCLSGRAPWWPRPGSSTPRCWGRCTDRAWRSSWTRWCRTKERSSWCPTAPWSPLQDNTRNNVHVNIYNDINVWVDSARNSEDWELLTVKKKKKQTVNLFNLYITRKVPLRLTLQVQRSKRPPLGQWWSCVIPNMLRRPILSMRRAETMLPGSTASVPRKLTK